MAISAPSSGYASTLEDEDVAVASRESDYKDMQGMLQRATTGSDKYLSEKTARKWFQEAMSQESPRAYFQDVIAPRMQEWSQVRQDFDEVTAQLKDKIASGSFERLEPEQFWKLPAKERFVYLKKAKESIRHSSSFEARFAKITKQVREYTNITFNDLKAASSQETQMMLEGLHHIKTENDLKGWESYANGLMQEQIKSARKLYYNQLMDPLLDALGKKLISTRVLKEMQEKFQDQNVGYKQKESYILDILPKRIQKWKEVKVQRERLLRHPNMKRLTTKQVKKLAAFKDEKAFIDLKYPERKGLADMIESMLIAQSYNLEGQHNSVQNELLLYVQDGRMHRSKVGTWMKRIFVENASAEQIKAFMATTVRPFAENWKKARVRLNAVNKEMNMKGIPRGFHRLTLSQFLQLEYEQRIAYVDEAESRMENDPNADGELASLTLEIRHCFDTQDWEGAGASLEKAKRLNQDDKAVRSMSNYFKTHRPKVTEEKKENPDPEKINTELQDMVDHIPGLLKTMYIDAMIQGSQEALMSGTYNLVWVHEHGYRNQHKDNMNGDSEENKDKTRDYIDNGHSKKLEQNILEGDTADQGAIKDKCTKAQMLHVGDLQGAKTVTRAFNVHQDDQKFRYWSTIRTKDISYEQHREVVRNYNYRIKMGMRTLDTLGYRFTLNGPPQKKNGSTTVVPSSKQHQGAKASIPAYVSAI
jgi:hypothetical protein